MDEFDYVIVEVDCGELRARYRLTDAEVPGSYVHDEDVSEWDDEDIIDLVCNMIECPRALVEIDWF